MSHNIVPFEFSGVTLTVIADANGDPEFEASSLCELLGYSNPWDAVKKHVKECDLVKREVTSPDATGSARKTQRKNFLKERGMWRLVMKSEAPNADAVQDWIAGDVLPSIRKTGSYAHPKVGAGETAEASSATLSPPDTAEYGHSRKPMTATHAATHVSACRDRKKVACSSTPPSPADHHTSRRLSCRHRSQRQALPGVRYSTLPAQRKNVPSGSKRNGWRVACTVPSASEIRRAPPIQSWPAFVAARPARA